MTDYVAEFSKAEPFRRGTHLVVFLHGYGSHEQDLMGLTGHLPGEKITFASLRAPQPVGFALPADAQSAYVSEPAMGYQWWPLNQQLETIGFRAIELAVDYVLGWLEPLAADFLSVTLLGFSQGMAMATSVARRRPDLVTAVVGLSGYVVEGGADFFADGALTGEKKLQLFWGRGDSDPVITADKIAFTSGWVTEHAETTGFVYPGLSHGVGADELAHVRTYLLEKVLG